MAPKRASEIEWHALGAALTAWPVNAEASMMKWRCWWFQLEIEAAQVRGVPDLRDDRAHQMVRQRLLATATPDGAALLDCVDRARGARPLLGGVRS
jgi:hypothetical protein